MRERHEAPERERADRERRARELDARATRARRSASTCPRARRAGRRRRSGSCGAGGGCGTSARAARRRACSRVVLRRAAGARAPRPRLRRAPRARASRRRSASQVVRRARTRRISRWPSSVRRKPDAPAIVARALALEEPCALEPVDVAGHRRRRDPLLARRARRATAPGCASRARAASPGAP